MAKARPISSVWGGSTTARYWPPARTSRPSIDGASSAIASPIRPDSVSSTSADRFTWAKASWPASGPVAAIWLAALGRVGRDDGRTRCSRLPGVVGEAGVDGGEEVAPWRRRPRDRRRPDRRGTRSCPTGRRCRARGSAPRARRTRRRCRSRAPPTRFRTQDRPHRRRRRRRRGPRARARRSLAGGRSTSRRDGRGASRSPAAGPRRADRRQGVA